MQLILSEADLERMPPELRRSLLRHLGGLEPAANGGERETTALTRTQATALLREVSFHRDGAAFHALLKRLAEDGAPPTRQSLAGALPAKARGNLSRHLAVLNRLTARATKRRDAKLWHYQRSADAYTVHPATRKALRDLLPVLARSGESEEPLWEG